MNTPIPKDLPLAIPVPQSVLVTLLVVGFLLHIVFVNLMVGGSILVFIFQWLGLKKPGHDDVAHEIAKTLTVNKSLAVVLGVGPLLCINLLYTVHFYTANALTGIAWAMVVPLVSLTFLLMYLHKYSWEAMALHRGLHVALAGFIVFLFLCIPFIFLVQANLMLFPERWSEVRGFFSAILTPSVLPRYFHFMAASVSVTSLFLSYWLTRKRYPVTEHLPEFTRPRLRKMFYKVTLATTVIQYLVGPGVLVSLPGHGLNAPMLFILTVGILFSLPAVILLWKEISGPDEKAGRHFFTIITLLFCTVVCMVIARHLYRDYILAPHKQAMAEKTEAYAYAVADAAAETKRGGPAAGSAPDGEATFQAMCAACHNPTAKTVGPALTEIAGIYAGNPDGIVKWTRAPGKKRADLMQMPAFGPAQIKDEALMAVAEYMIKTGGR